MDKVFGYGLKGLAAGLVFLTVYAAVWAEDWAKDEPLDLVLFGDSLFAGYGLANRDLLAERLQVHLTDKGYDAAVRQAAVSGDTAARARARFNWSVDEEASAVLIELGANDMFQARPVGAIRADLAAIIESALERELWVGLVGMRASRNVGPDYREAFDGLYADLAEAYCVPLYPFYFDGLIDPQTGRQKSQLFLGDRLHPNARGTAVVARRLGAWLDEALKEEAGCEAG